MAETILIVDDEEQIRSSVRGVLTDEGFRVLEADNGRSALATIAAEQPRLVLLDIWMPEIDGIELLTAIRKDGTQLPVIAISGGGSMPASLALSLSTSLGADAVLFKPFYSAELLDAVDRALRTRGGLH